MTTIALIFVLLVVYQLKHFIADYPLQTPYMLQKFKKEGWIYPLAAHAGVHALFTFAIAAFVTTLGFALALAIIDFFIHFAMDRIKASPDLLGRFKALTAKDYPTATDKEKQGNRFFWWALGLDQGVHHLTHYGLIAMMVLWG